MSTTAEFCSLLKLLTINSCSSSNTFNNSSIDIFNPFDMLLTASRVGAIGFPVS